jgi:predicted nucleotidyltransferase
LKQYEAVEAVAKRIVSDGLAQALLLKGSLARERADEYSDVDFYAIVSEENRQAFLGKRLDYLNAYMPILYHSEANFVGPQIVCVFENGLHFDFYTVTREQLNSFDQIAVLYDPMHLLDDYQPLPLSLSPEEIGKLVGSLCFTALEFHSAYMRQDGLFALRLANHIAADLGMYLRTVYDPEFAKIGLKGFGSHLEDTVKRNYLEIQKKLKTDTVLEAVQLMFALLDSYISNLPIKIAEHLNFDFYFYIKRLIMGMGK